MFDTLGDDFSDTDCGHPATYGGCTHGCTFHGDGDFTEQNDAVLSTRLNVSDLKRLHMKSLENTIANQKMALLETKAQRDTFSRRAADAVRALDIVTVELDDARQEIARLVRLLGERGAMSTPARDVGGSEVEPHP